MIAQPVEEARSLRVLARTSPHADPVLAIGATAEPEHPHRNGLIGSEQKLARLNALVDRVSETGSALLIRGATRTGKSALVAALVEGVRTQPFAILRASGIRAEANLPYAGLHQLLRPILGELGSLPRPHRRAIEVALGLTASPAPDPILVAIATLELLSIAARPSMVVVVEDAHWLDRHTSKVLSFVARRLSSDPIVLVITARDDRRSPILDAGLAELRLDGLDADEAARLLATGAPREDEGAHPSSAHESEPANDPWPLAISAAIRSADAASIMAAGRDRGQPDATRMLATQAWNDLHVGHWADAASHIEEVTELAQSTGQASWSLLAEVAAALLAAMRGDEETVDLALARAGSAAIASGQGELPSMIDVVRGISDLFAGRADAAYTRLRDRLMSLGGDASAWAIDHFADAAVLTGNVEEARAVLEARGGTPDGRLGPLQSASLAYAQALLADDATADQQQAVALADLVPWPIHRARLQLHRGAWLRRHRRVAESRMPLRAARDVFEALEAAPLAERARRELRASGERSRQRDITAWDQLSPQESEIAHMAAKGLSNREIAERLFLSHRTVGAHLYRIFPKLGVTSRGQLHTVLAGSVPSFAKSSYIA